MENIDDIDYRHGNSVFQRFKLKHLGEYHDLYVKVTLYYFEMYLKTLKICVLKCMSLIHIIFYHY